MQKDVKISFIEKHFVHFVKGCAALLILYFLAFHFTPLGDWVTNEINCSDKEEIMKQKWSGSIIKKMRIEDNHNMKCLMLSNYGSCLPLYGGNDILYDICNLNDSIIKEQGSLTVIIFKNDSIINYEYKINCKE